MSFLLVSIILILRNFSDDSAIWMLIKLAGFTYGPLIGLFFFGIITKRSLNDRLVPVVSALVPIVVASLWYLHGKGSITWFGSYQFGAELIIYNSLLSFLNRINRKHNSTNSKSDLKDNSSFTCFKDAVFIALN